jgi:hypothetical protein
MDMQKNRPEKEKSKPRKQTEKPKVFLKNLTFPLKTASDTASAQQRRLVVAASELCYLL